MMGGRSMQLENYMFKMNVTSNYRSGVIALFVRINPIANELIN